MYDCWKDGDGGTWTHLYDASTSWGGWVRDDFLKYPGSIYHC
jgi:hypothetical protein